jgi:hypothetical protein
MLGVWYDTYRIENTALMSSCIASHVFVAAGTCLPSLASELEEGTHSKVCVDSETASCSHTDNMYGICLFFSVPIGEQWICRMSRSYSEQ